MAFNLEITFRGMCFFVPDAQEKRMHVLMPATAGGGHCGEHVSPHHARLRYPARQMDPDAEPGDERERLFDGHELDLSGLDGGKAPLDLPPGVADLAKAAGLKIDREQLGQTPRASVAARVRLPAGADAPPEPGGKWLFGGSTDPVVLTNRVTLQLPQNGDSADVHLRPLAVGVAEPLTFRPVGGVVKLEVSYLPEVEPGDPPLGGEAPHFVCHYALFEEAPVRPIPRLHEKLPHQLPGGSPYTCLTAGAPPGP